MQIQLGEEESIVSEEPKPVELSTPLKIEEINEIYERKNSQKQTFANCIRQRIHGKTVFVSQKTV